MKPLTPVSPVRAARSRQIEAEKEIFSSNPSDGTGAAYGGGGRRGPGLARPGPRGPREAFAGPTLAPGRDLRATLDQTPPPKKSPGVPGPPRAKTVRHHPVVHALRCREEGICNSLRYLVTVRRATA